MRKNTIIEFGKYDEHREFGGENNNNNDNQDENNKPRSHAEILIE